MSLCQSGSTDTLQKLDMSEANFDSDSACMHLATLIDKALCLKHLDISDQKGIRKVLVSIEYAVAASGDALALKQGSISVKERYCENKVICQVPTGKIVS